MTTAAPAVASPPIRVLILEDQDADRLLLQHHIQSRSFLRPSFVDSVERCLGQLADQDALLVDLAVESNHGLDVVETLRARAAHLPIVVLASETDAEVRSQALDAGAQGFVAKPELSGVLLEHALRCAIERQQIQQHLETTGLELDRAYEIMRESRHAENTDLKLQSIGRIAASLSRELLQPLTIIEQGLERLADPECRSDPEAFAKQVRLIRSAHRKVRELAQDLGTFAEPKAIERVSVRLCDVINSAYETLRWENKLGTTEFEVESETDVPPVSVDAAQLEQGFYILFSRMLESKISPKRIAITIRNGGAPALGSALAVPGELKCVQCEVSDGGGCLRALALSREADLVFSVLKHSIKSAGGLFSCATDAGKPAILLTLRVSERLGA